MSTDRVAVFRDRVVINIDESPDAHTLPAYDKQTLVKWDPVVNSEILRLLAERTCAFCGNSMNEIEGVMGRVLICPVCGYWGGRGTRIDMGPADLRGVLGIVHRADLNDPDLTTGELVGHLRELPDRLLDLSPTRAERVVMDLIAEALECEVRPVGGVRDGGVDGYIVVGDQIKTIVQVKWHERTNKAESVGVIREIAGTLVARGVPSGLLITTRDRISPDAKSEIDQINQRELVGLGPLHMDVKTYNDVIDMLDLAWVNMGADFQHINTWLATEDGRFEVFG